MIDHGENLIEVYAKLNKEELTVNIYIEDRLILNSVVKEIDSYQKLLSLIFLGEDENGEKTLSKQGKASNLSFITEEEFNSITENFTKIISRKCSVKSQGFHGDKSEKIGWSIDDKFLTVPFRKFTNIFSENTDNFYNNHYYVRLPRLEDEKKHVVVKFSKIKVRSKEVYCFKLTVDGLMKIEKHLTFPTFFDKEFYIKEFNNYNLKLNFFDDKWSLDIHYNFNKLISAFETEEETVIYSSNDVFSEEFYDLNENEIHHSLKINGENIFKCEINLADEELSVDDENNENVMFLSLSQKLNIPQSCGSKYLLDFDILMDKKMIDDYHDLARLKILLIHKLEDMLSSIRKETTEEGVIAFREKLSLIFDPKELEWFN